MEKRTSCIPAISSRTFSSSMGLRLSLAKHLKASSKRPFWASHRGDSVANNRPKHMIPAGTNWNPNGMRQIAGPPATCLFTPSEKEKKGNEQADSKKCTLSFIKWLTIDKVANHHTQSYENLEHASDTTANLFRAAFWHVGGSYGRNGPHTQTSDNSSSVNVSESACNTIWNSLEYL